MTSPLPDVDALEARRLAEQGLVVLLDVREPAEWDAGHAPGAVHRPLGDLDPAGLAADGRFVAVCRSGRRSGLAAESMAAAGLVVHNLNGGMTAWAEADGPVVRDDGSPGIVAG